jgi:hypothetical protein
LLATILIEVQREAAGADSVNPGELGTALRKLGCGGCARAALGTLAPPLRNPNRKTFLPCLSDIPS